MSPRLSVNINDECADALRRIKAARGITTTEAIRRAISALDYLEIADTARLYGTPVQVCKACGNYTDTPGHFWGCAEAKKGGYVKPEPLPCLAADCTAPAVLGGWCEEHQ